MVDVGDGEPRLHVTYLITGFGSSIPEPCDISTSLPDGYLVSTTTLWLHSTRTIQVGTTSTCVLRF